MQQFCKGGGRRGGGNLEYLKKRGGGGRSCKQCQGEHWKTIFKKNSLVIVRGVRLTQVEGRGRGGAGAGGTNAHIPP